MLLLIFVANIVGWIYLTQRCGAAEDGLEVVFYLTLRRNAPAPQASGCLSEANPKGRKGPREAEFAEGYFGSCDFAQ